MAIYSDNSSKPGTIVASTTDGTLRGNSWNSQNLSVTLQPNTAYWIMYNGNGDDSSLNYTFYDDVSSRIGYWKGCDFGNWPQKLTGGPMVRAQYSMCVEF